MTLPLQVEPLTPNGEIRTADLLTSIVKRLRFIATRECNLPVGAGSVSRRVDELLRYAEQLDALASAMEPKP